MRAAVRGHGGRGVPAAERGRRALLLVAALSATALGALAMGLAGCGGSSDSSGAGERESDAEIVNVALSRELTLIDAFDAGAPYLKRPFPRQLVRQFRGQEQEHMNGLTKALRGLGGDFEADAAEIDLSGVKSERDYLLYLYDVISTTLTGYLEAVPHLATPAPRAMAASIGASQAQHLVQLRQALGAGVLEAAPEAFDTGEVPPPEGAGPGGERGSQPPPVRR